MKKNIKSISIFLLFVTTICSASGQNKPRYQLPNFDKVQLANGLVIYFMEKHDVPIISLDAIVPAGAVNDGEQAGLASLTGTCLKCGTKSFTKKEIEERFDFLGADLHTYGSNDNAGLSTKFAAKDKDKLLPMIKEMLVNPVFSEEDFDKEKKLTLPLIFTLNKVAASKRRELIYIIKNENRDPARVKLVIDTVVAEGGIRYAEQKMNQYRDEALAILYEFPDSEVRKALEELVRFTTDRKY